MMIARILGLSLLAIALLFAPRGNAVTDSFTINVTVGAQTPGPSAALYNSHPYYTCTTNFFVSTSGTSSGTGASGSPWDIQTASTKSLAAGSCINVAAGTYNVGTGGGLVISHGGTSSSQTGYVVWRCQTMPFSFSSTSALQGEGNGCVLTNTAVNNNVTIGSNVSYVMFDSFEFSCTASNGGVGLDNENGGNSAAKSHHLWVLNSDIHHCGLSGLQWNNTDWLFAIHNVWHDNGSISGFMGSGLSIYEAAGLTSYTPTSGNPDFWHSATSGRTYNIVIAYNVGYRNYNTTANATNTSDGEGIILDDWSGSQSGCSAIVGTSGATCPYGGNALVMGNIMWGNGGNGIEVFSMTGPPDSTAHIEIINNTTYSNAWDTHNSGTFGAGLLANGGLNTTWWNNIAVTVTGTRSCANTNISCSILDQLGGSDTWANNMAFPSGQTSFANGVTYPTTGTNKNDDGVNPLLSALNPITSSTGTGVSNFALCTGAGTPVAACTAASPAIGFGRTFDLWQQSGSIDAGACPSGLTHCP